MAEIVLGRLKFKWKSNWATSTSYIVDDIVKFNANSFVCVTNHTSSATVDGWFASDFANWQLYVPGINSTGLYNGSTKYYLNDIATYLGNTWICTTNATVGRIPSNGSSYWTLLAQGNADQTDNVYYVDTNGNDYSGDGKTMTTAWASLRHACDSVTGPATIYVRSGTYYEQLPITVPPSVSIIGDNMRDTKIAPKPTGVSTDSIPTTNNLSTMFLLSDATLLQGLLMTGMTSFTPSLVTPSDITLATLGGVYLRLNPASPVSTKSPYIKDCTSTSSGGVGAVVDGSVHGSGNKSMVFWAYNMVMDNGVGLYVLNGGKAEAVSCFTYYAYFGYATSGGGKIRSLSGNNSYGTYGAVSRGYDSTEVANSGTVYGNMLTGTQSGSFQVGETITQAVSGATGTVTSVQTGYLYYKPTANVFDTTHLVTGGTSSATVTPSAVTGQNNYVLVLSGLSALPKPGASIEFATGDTSSYVIQSVSGGYVNTGSIITVTLAQQKATPSIDTTVVRIRYNFSQIRLTGHDFLSIGTGGTSTTNYPNIPTQSADASKQTVYVYPGRVYYVSTDQDGNFSVGPYFAVNQATGAATLNASAFNLSGLTSLRLGSIGAQLGAQVDEFSTDGTLNANSSTKVPTQSAIRTYLGAAYQSISPVTDLTYDLGTPSKRWGHVYVGAGSITIGTLTISDNSGTLQVQAGSTNAPTNINSINNGTSNITVANNANVTVTAAGTLALTASSTLVTTALPVTITNTTVSGASNAGALVVTGGAGVGGNLYVGGNLQITGNVVYGGTVSQVTTTVLNVADPLIYLAQNNGANINDIGIVGHFTQSPTGYQHTGFVRQASTNQWILFSGATTEPSNVITTSDGTFTYDTLKLGSILNTGNAGFGTSSPNVGSNASTTVTILGATTSRSTLEMGNTSSVTNGVVAQQSFLNATTQIALIQVTTDGTNADSGLIKFFTRPTGGSTTERVRVTQAGQLTVGNFAGRSNFMGGAGNTPQVQVEGTTAMTGALSVVRNSADGNPAYIIVGKSRAGAVNGDTAVQNTELIGTYDFQANDGTNMLRAASIGAFVNGTVTTGAVPGGLTISTANAAGTLAPAITVSATQTVTFNNPPFEGTNKLATMGRSIAMAMVFG